MIKTCHALVTLRHIIKLDLVKSHTFKEQKGNFNCIGVDHFCKLNKKNSE